MPYIKEARREKIIKRVITDHGVDLFIKISEIKTAGEANYAITELVKFYFENRGANYQAINDIVGFLESSKAEFQRRIVSELEDEKIKENGDVY